MTIEQLAKAAKAFQHEIEGSYGEEYGISDEDAARGVLAALQSLGFANDVDAKAISEEWERQKDAERRERDEREKARRAGLTPEQRATEDVLEASSRAAQESLLNLIADDLFRSAHVFNEAMKKRNK